MGTLFFSKLLTIVIFGPNHGKSEKSTQGAKSPKKKQSEGVRFC